MKAFYDKYIANVFGILSSACVIFYIFIIFFAGISPHMLFSWLLNGRNVNGETVTTTCYIAHILSAAFLFLFYLKYFSAANSDRVIKILSIIFSTAAVVLSVFSYNLDNLPLLITANGILLAAFMFIRCIACYYYEESPSHPLIKLSRIIMAISVVLVFVYIFCAATINDITSSVISAALGTEVGRGKLYAISYMSYIIAGVFQIAQFIMMYVADRMLFKLYQPYQR